MTVQALLNRGSTGMRSGIGLLVGAILLLGGCTERPADRAETEASPAPQTESPRALVFQCTGDSGAIVNVRAQVHPDSLTLRVPPSLGGGARRLAAVRAADGDKYVGDAARVWRWGDTATVEVGGRRFRGCTVAPQTRTRTDPAQEGPQFRAIGQEPGWLAEVTADSLRFAWAYGQHEVVAPHPRRETDEGRIVYTAATDRGRVRIVAEPRRCTDPMNGRVFSHTVTVTLAGQTHTGCGRPLREWRP